MSDPTPAHPRWPDGSYVLIGDIAEHRRHGLARVVCVGVDGLAPSYVELSRRWYQPRRLVSVKDLKRLETTDDC